MSASTWRLASWCTAADRVGGRWGRRGRRGTRRTRRGGGHTWVHSTLPARRLLTRFPAKLLLLASVAIVGLGQLWLAQSQTHGSYPVNVLGGLILTALGMGIIFPVASVAVTAGMPSSQRRLAGGLFTTAQQLGQAVGLAIPATIAAARTAAEHGDLAARCRAAYVVAVGIVAVALVTTVFQHSGSQR